MIYIDPTGRRQVNPGDLDRHTRRRQHAQVAPAAPDPTPDLETAAQTAWCHTGDTTCHLLAEVAADAAAAASSCSRRADACTRADARTDAVEASGGR